MNWFERWILKGIIRKQVRQDYDHPEKIEALFSSIIQAARDEFTEDNRATQDEYLTDWFKNALCE